MVSGAWGLDRCFIFTLFDIDAEAWSLLRISIRSYYIMFISLFQFSALVIIVSQPRGP